MRNTTLIKTLLILTTTLLLAIFLPRVVKMTFESATRYNFTYYSSILKQFCAIEYKDKDLLRLDADGNQYTEAQFDSILPLFSYRQLMTDGNMPDTINGEPISIERIRNGAFYLRVKPRDVLRPEVGLYPMYESMSGRVKLDVPDDFFRCKSSFEFIDAATNTVNVEKSQLFDQALTKKGFTYPAKWVAGIPSARKAYDEGYFICDSKNQLFHLKQVNGKPFVKNTQVDEQLVPSYFKMVEAPDRSFYGFLFDDQQQMYQLSTDNYALKVLPFKFDYTSQQMMVMANTLFWNVNIISDAGKHTYAINADSFEQVDVHFQEAPKNNWEQVFKWVFPFAIELEHPHTAYVYPSVSLGGVNSLLVSALLLAVWIGFINRKQRSRLPLIVAIPLILVGGVFCFISLLIYKK